MRELSGRLRAPDPTLDALDDRVILRRSAPDDQLVAHREHLEPGEIVPFAACGVQRMGNLPRLMARDAAYTAVPCRQCFPDAPPPGTRLLPSPLTGFETREPFHDDALAWQLPAAEQPWQPPEALTRSAPMGDGRRYYLDLAADADRVPEPGTVLRAPRVDHEIVDCWPTDSKVWPWRWTCILRPLGEHHGAPPPAGALVLHTRPYRRGEGPHDCFDDPDRSEVRP